MHTFEIKSQKENDIINITDKVSAIVEKSGVNAGICTVYVPHATAAIIINENWDISVCKDILKTLDQLIPKRNNYEHDKIDGNSASHIKASILGPSETIIIKAGKLQLGTWQGIALIELDGPKERKVFVKIIEG